MQVAPANKRGGAKPMPLLNCPKCSAPMERSINQWLIEPCKVYLELTCPEGHGIRQIDITDDTAGMTSEELRDYGRNLIQELESA